MKIATFLRKNADTAKRVVDCPKERDTFRNKIVEIVGDFGKKSYNNNGKPWKSSRIFRVNPNFFIFSFSSFWSLFPFISFTLFHVLSFSVIFFHFLSCSFFFFSFFIFSFVFSFFLFLLFLSFFLFLFLCVGGSKSVFFLGLNFVTISLNIFEKKTIFWAVSGVPLWGLFSFFSSLFLSSFFPPFSFSSFSSSWILFSFYFVFFTLLKMFFFIFLFQYLYQGLTVSSVVGAPWRCSVLTDIRRDSWDWVGPPAREGRQHASTPQSGVEAPRLSKTEPLQIVLLLLLLLLLVLYYCCCCLGHVFNSVYGHHCDDDATVTGARSPRSQDSRRPRQPTEPSMTKNSWPSRARKIRAPRDSPNCHWTLSMTESEAPPLLKTRTGMSTTLSVNANALHCLDHKHLSCTTA